MVLVTFSFTNDRINEKGDTNNISSASFLISQNILKVYIKDTAMAYEETFFDFFVESFLKKTSLHILGRIR